MPNEVALEVSGGDTRENDGLAPTFAGPDFADEETRDNEVIPQEPWQRLVFIAGLLGWLVAALTTWTWIN